MRNSVGVWKLAATVCPMVTLRETTVPFTGDTIFVYVKIHLGRAQFGVALHHRRLIELDLGLGLVVHTLRAVERVLRHDTALQQPLIPLGT